MSHHTSYLDLFISRRRKGSATIESIELDCIHLSALRNPYITINTSSAQHTQTNSTKQQIFLLYSPLKFVSLSLKHRQRQQDQQQYTKHGDKITIRHIY